MSYWHNDTSDQNARTQGKRMLSQYQLGRAAMSASGTKPTFFHNAADVELFYPPVASQQALRRTRPGGANVLRTAQINDTLAQQSAVNREYEQNRNRSQGRAATGPLGHCCGCSSCGCGGATFPQH